MNIFVCLEIAYKILIQTGEYQEEGDHSRLHITIFGKNGQTKMMPLNETTRTDKTNLVKANAKIEYEFKTNDVGKVLNI